MRPKAKWNGDPNWTLLKDAHDLACRYFASEKAAEDGLRSAFADEKIETMGVWYREHDGSLTYANIHVKTDQLLLWLEERKRGTS